MQQLKKVNDGNGVAKSLNGEEKYKFPMDYEAVADLLGRNIRSIRSAKSYLKEQLIEGEDFVKVRGVKAYSPPVIVWGKSGVIKLAQCFRLSKKAGIFLENMGIVKRHKSKIEDDCIDTIIKAIDGFTSCRKRYNIDGLELDLYLPDLNLAIECDEHGHKGYAKWKENWREGYIRENLKCDFLRFNPNENEFNIGNVLNKIFSLILNKDAKDGQVSFTFP